MENETIKHLSDFNEMLYQRLQDVEHRLERLKIICSSLGANDFSAITSQITSLETEISSIKQSVKTNTTTLSNLTTSVESNTNSISNLTSNVNSNSTNIQSLQTITNNHTSKLATYDEQLKAIDIDTITQNQEKLGDLETAVQTNTADILTVRDRSLNNEVNITNLNSKFESYKELHEDENYFKFGEIDIKFNNLQNTTSEHNTKINTLEQNVSTNTVNITKNSSQIEQLKTQLENSKIENELSFILNGTYLLQSDIDSILDGTYTI